MKKWFVAALFLFVLLLGFGLGGFTALKNQELFAQIVLISFFGVIFVLIAGTAIMGGLGALSYGELTSPLKRRTNEDKI